MLELEEAERYAIAALFTLALHSGASQADGGAEGWGEPEDPTSHHTLDTNNNTNDPDPFWGRDLVLAGGLLDAVYFLLGLPPFKWSGLKALPSIAPSSDSAAFRGAVRSLIAVLDLDLAESLPAPSTKKRRELSPRGCDHVDVPDELWDGLLSSSDDEELQKDRHWERHLEEQLRQQEQVAAAQRLVRAAAYYDDNGGGGEDDVWDVESPIHAVAEAKKSLLGIAATAADSRGRSPKGGAGAGAGVSVLAKQRSEEYAELVKQLEALTTCSEEESDTNVVGGEGAAGVVKNETEKGKAENDNEEKVKVKAKKGVDDGDATKPKKPVAKPQVSPIALAALWELLQCCIGAGSAAAEAAKAATEEQKEFEQPNSPKILRRQGPLPCVRWYDARARVALGLVSAWLQVPPRKFATLEVLLGSDKAPKTVLRLGHDTKNGKNASADRYRYLKVGLAALGGGALFAVTGGLAAPAIAAGVGSLLGIVPGAGAAAGAAVAGFMSTQVGVAAVTTTMATAGAATTGSKMAYRTAEVKDFGFLEIKDAPQRAALVVSAGSGGSGGTTYNRVGESNAGSEEKNTLNNNNTVNQREQQASKSGGDRDRDRGHLMTMTPTRSSSSVSSMASTGSGRGWGAQDPDEQLQPSSSWKTWFGSGSGTTTTAAAAATKGEMPGTKADSSKQQQHSGGEEEAMVLLPMPIRPSHPAEGIKLSTVIGVSGWISCHDDYIDPWRSIPSPTADKFALVWCTSELQVLNSALGALLAKGAAGQAARIGMQHLLVGGAGLVSALGPTVILGAATGLLIENAWTVALDRSDKAGKLLAHVLMSGGGGGRPVTLIAHSMGARLVFAALLELCRHGARGLVQDVVLLGAPVPPATERWRMARRVVAGRFVNGYSRGDWLLSVMFWQGIAKPAAGLAPVEAAGVENVSLSSIVGGHFDYIGRLDEILEVLQVEMMAVSGG